MRAAGGRQIILATLAAVAALAWPVGVQAQGSPLPSVRLVAAGGPATLYQSRGRVQLDLGVWVAATGGSFELRAKRSDYDAPIRLQQVDAGTGEVLRDLSDVTLNGWFGLPRAVRVVVRDPAGAFVKQRRFAFCPNSFDRQRVDDSGPVLSPYPTTCGSFSPFTKGMVWGIDSGWATNALGGSEFDVPSIRLSLGKYTVDVEIAQPYAEMLEVSPEDAHVSLAVAVKPPPRGCCAKGRAALAPAGPPGSLAVPDVVEPDPATVPDLVALPLWGMSTFTRRGRDFLTFAATPWNAGPAPLVVEGFRRPGEDVMDAYQYFRDADGNVVGRAPAGSMRFHAHPSHNHWHFLQFAQFTLQHARDLRTVRSRKQAFCLAPTDAIDLIVERADWMPWDDVSTMCGTRGALWVREVLHTGWSDTYYQGIPGQAFGITGLPNGWYYARMELNPLGNLHEVTTENNVESRLVYLGGRAGHRWVLSSPWHGIEE